MESSSSASSIETSEPSSVSLEKKWKQLSRDQRRVLGVLIEKSKTTADVYPMSINGIKTGCNQKSNRSPLMELDDHRVEDVLYELRQLGCVMEVHSGGRVPKYKHQAYDWLNVTQAELSVLTELLLRGEQTLGDLRARSARMEKEIETLDDLRPIVASLKTKGLIVELTPAGRGQIVTHNLYLANEIDRLKQSFDSANFVDSDEETNEGEESGGSQRLPRTSRPALISSERFTTLSQRVDQLESLVAHLKEQLANLKRTIES